VKEKRGSTKDAEDDVIEEYGELWSERIIKGLVVENVS